MATAAPTSKDLDELELKKDLAVETKRVDALVEAKVEALGKK